MEIEKNLFKNEETQKWHIKDMQSFFSLCGTLHKKNNSYEWDVKDVTKINRKVICLRCIKIIFQRQEVY